MDALCTEDELGIAHSWGEGPEVVFLSNPQADPVSWSSGIREELLARGHRVTAFAHRPRGRDWRSAVDAVVAFIARSPQPVAVVGWSQGAVIAQEVALGAPQDVRAAVLLAPYGRQNAIDRVLQAAWDHLAHDGPDEVREALRLLTAFPPERLADDGLVRRLLEDGAGWGRRPDPEARDRAARFIVTYQERLPALARISRPCLVMGFALDTDTFAARAREVAAAIPGSSYLELPGLGHAAPMSDPEQVWPPVLRFLEEHHPGGVERSAPGVQR